MSVGNRDPSIGSMPVTTLAPTDFREALACPACGRDLAPGGPFDFACGSCPWRAPLVNGDTPSFVDRVLDGPRLRRDESPDDERVHTHGPRGRLERFLERTLFCWRRPLIRWIEKDDPGYWRRGIHLLRDEEMKVVHRLFRRHLEERGRFLLELGVGFRDHTALYDAVCENAICSDIYRDGHAAELHAPRQNSLYALLDAHRLPLRPASIDVLFTSHVVEHFPDLDGDLRALHRVMKTGGLACHVVPISRGFVAGHLLSTLLNIVTATPRLGRGVHGEFRSVGDELRRTTVRAWREQFESSGFEIVDSAPGTLGLRPLPPRLSRKIARVLRFTGSWVFLTRAVEG